MNPSIEKDGNGFPVIGWRVLCDCGKRFADYLVDDQPHCQDCMLEAVDSEIPVTVRKYDSTAGAA